MNDMESNRAADWLQVLKPDPALTSIYRYEFLRSQTDCMVEIEEIMLSQRSILDAEIQLSVSDYNVNFSHLNLIDKN
jgi:hypothetical protein